jgi:hypothetical protein
MNKIELYLIYKRDEVFWRSYIELSKKLSNIKQEILTTSDTEKTVLESLKLVQQALSMVDKNKDKIEQVTDLPKDKEIEKTLFDLEDMLIDLLGDE